MTGSKITRPAPLKRCPRDGELCESARCADHGCEMMPFSVDSDKTSEMGADRMANVATAARNLDDELRRRLWRLYDAAKVIAAAPDDDPTIQAWADFHRAVADVPESQRGK